MSCYFIVSTHLDAEKDRTHYDEYIRQVRPIVERYGGEYLVRTEQLTALSERWKPDRLIIIRFPDRTSLDHCFSSTEYQSIVALRTCCTDSRAVIAEGVSYEDF
ncbi:MAG: DUF1330 domain-containing protein [Butyricicoccaceae bacterium]